MADCAVYSTTLTCTGSYSLYSIPVQMQPCCKAAAESSVVMHAFICTWCVDNLRVNNRFHSMYTAAERLVAITQHKLTVSRKKRVLMIFTCYLPIEEPALQNLAVECHQSFPINMLSYLREQHWCSMHFWINSEDNIYRRRTLKNMLTIPLNREVGLTAE